MYCRKCGAKLSDTAEICLYCSTLVNPPEKKPPEKKDSILTRLAETPQPKSSAKQRIRENKADGVACCPKCGSTSLSINKKGFGIGKAAAGAVLLGGVGLLAGGIGSNKLVVTCLNCGHKFKPGKK